MKIKHIIYIILSEMLMYTSLFAQVASANWPLTSDQNSSIPIGNIQTLSQFIGTPASPYKLEMYPQQPYTSRGQQLWTGNQGTGWIAGLPDYTRYIQFDASPTSGNNFNVQYISFDYSDTENPSNFDFKILKSEVWYSTDNWTSQVQLNSNPLDYLTSAIQTFSANVNVMVQSGQTFSLRIYPYAPDGAIAMAPSFATHRNVFIEGTTSPVVTDNASICGMKFWDYFPNGIKDESELLLGLSDWTITLSMGAVQMTTTTDSNGSYCFNDLAEGTYTLMETPQDGWQQTYPTASSAHTITLSPGERVENVDFGNKRLLGSISGKKFNDVNGTGDQQLPDEPGLPNWTINIIGPVSTSITTDSDGQYNFDNLPPGTYTVTETNQSGWQQTYPLSPGSYTVVLAEGELIFNKDFANQVIPPQPGSICGIKFNDLNSDGQKNANETGLSGWTIAVSNDTVQMTTTTGIDGSYCFNDLPAGTYTLSETPQTGWEQTFPANGIHTVTITPGLNLIGIDFGNTEVISSGCTDFENNSTDNWQVNNTLMSIQQNGENHYIQTTDQSGASYFFNNSKPLTGNWSSLFEDGCGSLCFDVNFLYGGNPYNGINPPQTFTPQIAIEGNGFKAAFVANNQITVGDGWHSYCAPLSYLNYDGTLPSNSDGYWVMTVGSNNDWNSLLSNVTKVILPVDPTSYQSEKFGYDNICLKNTGDCNSPLRLGSICGIKIHDKNGDGIKDGNEDGLPNWTITLTIGTTTYSTTTDENGNYCFNDLPAGTYSVSEVNEENWRQVYPTEPGIHTVTLLPGQNITNINFSNIEDPTAQLGSICGTKFNDLNENGINDGEPGLPNWTFQLTGASNMTTTTDLMGNFCFTNLKPGDYTITEIFQDGWEATTPNPAGTYSVTLLPGQILTDINFGNKEILGSVCGVKYNDLNGNGSHEEDEPLLSNWVISLTGTMDLDTTTDDKGNYCFSNLKPGKYNLREVNKDGWIQTDPSTITYSFELTAGQNLIDMNFGNKEDSSIRLGSICGMKFNDLNDNGKKDDGELGISEWQIQIEGPVDITVATDRDGNYCFDNLPPGEYKVGEVMRNGWRQTLPSTNFYIIQLESGQNMTAIDFGNTIDDKVQLGSICGIKFNDKNGDTNQNVGELGIPNWTIYLTGSMTLTATTDDNGSFCFYGLIPGTYTVREENKVGWRQTKPSSVTYTIEIGNGDNFTGINFGNIEDKTVQLGSICGIKFNDVNGNGINDGEPVLSNWTINLTGTSNLTTTTDSRGYYCFTNLTFGNYTISEQYKDGWTQTAPQGGVYTIELTADNNPADINFGNKVDTAIILGAICGIKFNDNNGNGTQDAGELGIPDWQINLAGPVDMSVKTDKNGNYCFDNLPPGEYLIKEESQNFWTQTYPASPGTYTLALTPGQSIDDINFGNKYEPNVGCVNPPSGMVAWWSLDYSARDSRQDFAGFNNFGSMVNGPIQVTGKVLGALQFDGIDDYVEVADHSELNFGTGGFSFDAYIKTTSSSGINPIIEKRDPVSGNGYLIFLHDGNLGLQLADASLETNYISAVFVADGNWHHIAVTVSRANKNGIIFYVDGVPTPFGDPTLHPGSLNNTNPLRIGKEFGIFASQFVGILDEIELFKRVITPSEVESIFNAGSAGKCKPTVGLGSVFGHVFYDQNGNGIEDFGEKPLSNWNVFTNGPITGTILTDADGNYSFTNLKPGVYNISVAGQSDWSFTFPSNGNYTFEIAPDMSIENLNFGFTNDPCGTGLKTWQPLGAGFNSAVYALATDGTLLYAGGTFTSAGGITTNHIAKWNGSSWSDVGGGINGSVNAILIVGNDLYAGGTFTMAGNVNAKNIARWDGTSWSALGSGINGNVSSLAVVGTDLYVGGLFSAAGGVNAKNIAKWDGANWSALNGGVITNGSYGVLALASIGNDLYVGGGFWGTGGANAATNIIKWNTSNSTWAPMSTGLNDRVYALSVMNGELYAGGGFSLVSGLNSINHIAKWNGVGWIALGDGTSGGVSGWNWALAAQGTDIYVGGQFAMAGSTSANGVAKWDGSDWFALSNGVGGFYYRTVMALTIIGSDIYAGGVFTTAGNINANYIAKYSCSSIPTSINDDDNQLVIPQSFHLDQNYPNPFNPTSTIRFNIPKSSFVKIIVYDILGREVRVLVNEEKNPGRYEVVFDGKGLASGIYFYIINSDEFTQAKKMILIK